MNTLQLQQRLKQYSRIPISASVESVQNTLSPTEHLDYEPNPVIVNEFLTDTLPEDNFDTYDKLISEGVESLRRLDIIKASINYPVSGYRTNMATLLAADPGLESLVSNVTFTKRQLTTAIEGNKFDIIVSLLGLIVMLFGKRLASIFINLRRKLYDKRYNIGPGNYQALTRAAHSNKTISWKLGSAAVSKNTPIYYKKIAASKKIVCKDYVQALLDEYVSLNTHVVVDSMIGNKRDMEKSVALSNKLPTPVGLFLSDIEIAIDKLNAGYVSGKLDAKEIGEDLILDNEDFIAEVREYEELARIAMSTKDTSGKMKVTEYLIAVEYLINLGNKIDTKAFMKHEKHIGYITGKLDKVQKVVSNMRNVENPDLINEVQSVVITLRRATDTIITLMTIVDNQTKLIKVLEHSIDSVQSALPSTFY